MECGIYSLSCKKIHHRSVHPVLCVAHEQYYIRQVCRLRIQQSAAWRCLSLLLAVSDISPERRLRFHTYWWRESIFTLPIENVFRVCIAWYKHERGWENSRQLCKPETKSSVENSPNASSVYIRLGKHRKKVFYYFYKITFPRKNAKLFVMALIKREILTSRKALSTKSCTRNQFLL